MIEIGDKKVGYGYPPIISAELSISHQGNLETALEMIDKAAQAGADSIKLQYYKTEDFAQPDGETITYKQRVSNMGPYLIPKKRTDELQRYEYSMEEITESIYDLFKRNEISLDFVKACQERAKKHDLIFGVTTTSVEGVKEMAEIGVDYLKIASDQINEKDMIDEMAKTGLRIIASTGHIKSLRDIKNIKIWANSLWLHCVSEYPAKNPKLWRLSHMQQLIALYEVGYSHHGTDWRDIVRACELGSVWNEFHWTLDKTMAGPDHHFSLDPTELKQLVEAIK